jgi:hypothetical protein
MCAIQTRRRRISKYQQTTDTPACRPDDRDVRSAHRLWEPWELNALRGYIYENYVSLSFLKRVCFSIFVWNTKISLSTRNS